MGTRARSAKARDGLITLLGQVLPLFAAFFSIPILIRHLGVGRYGVLALTGVFGSYFSLLDFGMGRATTKFVAQALAGSDEAFLRSSVWTAVWFQGGLGVIAGAGMALAAPWLITGFLNVAPEIAVECRDSFLVFSACIPVAMACAVFRGVLKGSQHFLSFNLLQAMTSVILPIATAAAASMGIDLPGVVSVQLVGLLASLSGLVAASLIHLPVLRRPAFPKIETARVLMSFGGWIMLLQVISKAAMQVDRLLIGSLLNVRQVGYYTPAYTLSSKMMLIPSSLDTMVFPVFGAMSQSQDGPRLEKACALTWKYLLILLAPLAVLLAVFAEPILTLWPGQDFALHSGASLRWLSIGFLFHAFAWLPSCVFQGVGKPGIIAVVTLLELPLYLGAAYWMILALGIEGAALAWAGRGAIEAVSLTLAVFLTLPVRPRNCLGHGVWQAGASFCLLSASMILIRVFSSRLGAWECAAIAALLAGYCAGSIFFALDEGERRALLSMGSRNLAAEEAG